MKPVASLAAALLTVAVGPTAWAGEAKTAARATVVEPMGVRMSWPMAMPSVQGGRSGATFMGNMPSMAMGMMMPANAIMLVRRQDDTGEPITAPASFEVINDQGDRALVVRTGGASETRIASDGAIVGGALVGGAAASIEVGRGLSLASTGGETTPASGSLLVVVVQYN